MLGSKEFTNIVMINFLLRRIKNAYVTHLIPSDAGDSDIQRAQGQVRERLGGDLDGADVYSEHQGLP